MLQPKKEGFDKLLDSHGLSCASKLRLIVVTETLKDDLSSP